MVQHDCSLPAHPISTTSQTYLKNSTIHTKTQKQRSIHHSSQLTSPKKSAQKNTNRRIALALPQNHLAASVSFDLSSAQIFTEVLSTQLVVVFEGSGGIGRDCHRQHALVAAFCS